MKKILSFLLCASMLGCCVLSGCGESSSDSGSSESAESSKSEEKTEDPVKGVKAVASTDKYRNVYQIFTQSFCDSNGDSIGDF